MDSTLPAISTNKDEPLEKRSDKLQAAKYAGKPSDETQPIEKQSVRVRLSSGIMDELMDKAYASVYDPFRELIANSYDANAYKVRIEIENEHSCFVDDDGYGISDFNSFLTKGMTEKRQHEERNLRLREAVHRRKGSRLPLSVQNSARD